VRVTLDAGPESAEDIAVCVSSFGPETVRRDV
jgi:hypothetical protein